MIVTDDNHSQYQAGIGGKAKNLFYLHRNGINIPSFLCLSSDAFNAFIAPLKTDIDIAFKRLLNGSYLDAAKVSTHIQNILSEQNIDHELATAILHSLKRGNSTLYSVRSSALSEDSAEQSFAGLFKTFLCVPYDNIISSIKQCWIATYSPSVLFYCVRKGINPIALDMGVVIQEMIHSVSSGIMFTANPTGSPTEIMVVAGYGLGEGIVSGQVGTDTYIFNRESKHVHKEIETKRHQIVFNEEQGCGLSRKEVPSNVCGEQVLNDDQLKDIIDLGLKVGDLYDHCQDIEWCIDKSGKIHILQSRPITTILRGEHTVFDNSNISENFPGITLPLTFSVLNNGYKNNFSNMVSKLSIKKKRIKDNQHYFENMLGYVQGRIYYNLNSWYGILGLLPLPVKVGSASFDDMVGICTMDHDSHKKNSVHKIPFWERLAFLLKVLWWFFAIDRYFQRYKNQFKALSEEILSDNPERFSNHQLINYIRQLNPKWFSITLVPLINDFLIMIFMPFLKTILSKSGFNDVDNLFNEILCGEEDLESVRPVRSVVRLAEIVRNDRRLHERLNSILQRKDGMTQLRNLVNNPSLTEFFESFKSHLNLYGDRCPEELKLEVENFRDNPLLLLKTILRNVPTEITINSMRKNELAIRKGAEERVRFHLKNKYFRRKIIFYFIERARQLIKNRESGRLDRARLNGISKNIVDMLSQRLKEEGAIESGRDIFYLTIDEIVAFIFGCNVDVSLKQTANNRKELFSSYLDKDPVERLIFKGTIARNFIAQRRNNKHCSNTSMLKGTTCCPGDITGDAVVITDPANAPDVNGKILVAKNTDPGWVFLMISSAGLIVERGSLLSHTAIIGRELGIPTIVGVENATKIIKTGQRIRVNANDALIELM